MPHISVKPDPFLTDEDNPELTAEDFARMRPLQEVDPDMLKAVANYRKRRSLPVLPGQAVPERSAEDQERPGREPAGKEIV
jgi:hypothetical protein